RWAGNSGKAGGAPRGTEICSAEYFLMVCAVIFTAEYQRGLIAQPIYYYLNSKKDEIDEISLQINPSLVSLVVISIYAIKYATTHELWWKEPAFFLMFLDVGLSIVV